MSAQTATPAGEATLEEELARLAERVLTADFEALPWPESGVAARGGGLAGRPTTAELPAQLPLLAACANLIARLRAAESEARTDPLTALPNRRAWEEALDREEERCRRFGHPAVVVTVDLDDFKQVNDRFGHAAGDAYLRRAATALTEGVRGGDLVARWGGDEFAVLAVECDERAAQTLCRRIEETLCDAAVPASLARGQRADAGLRGAAADAFRALRRCKHARVTETVS